MARGIAEDLTNQKINHWTVLHELGGGYVTAQCDCGAIKKIRKSQIKNGHSKSCGCLSGKQKRDIVGQKINHWTIIEEVGEGKVLCQCDCAAGTVKELYKKAVYEGKSKSCGCASGRQKRDIVGQKINHWSVLEDLGHGKVRCQCDCEAKTVRILYKKAVYEGKTKSCGCAKVESMLKTKENNKVEPTSKYIGTTVKGWTVISKVKGEEKLICKDKDGNQRMFYIAHVARGGIAEPDYYTKNDLTGKKINHWTVLEELGQGKVRVQCDCANKTTKIIYKSTLTREQSKSCGCVSAEMAQATMMKKYGDLCTLKIDKPREIWQIETINNQNKFIEYLKKIESDKGNKPNVQDLVDLLGVNKASVLRTIHKHKAESFVQFMYGESYAEKELYEYIKSISTYDVINHCRDVLDNQYELDIYIPEIKIAIEFNGNYWHSNIYKDKEYHQLKTLMCAHKNIRLIHIFEYEWINDKDSIKLFLKSCIDTNKIKVYAKQCEVKDISSNEAKEFENRFHLQRSVPAKIYKGLVYEDQLIGLMTFGVPRFDNNYDYELIRLCFNNCYSVVGGAEKLFKSFIDTFDKVSVVSYCDITKFGGNVYKRLSFKIDSVTSPNYVWCGRDNKILTRYQTQKHKLLELGIGEETQSESEIMENLGYFKIYNSGNIKYIYNK